MAGKQTFLAAGTLLAMVVGCSKTQPANNINGTNPADSNGNQSVNVSPGGKSGTSGSPGKQSGPAKPFSVQEFPIPNKARLVEARSTTGTIVLRGNDTIDSYMSFYETSFDERGWKKNESKSEMLDGFAFLQFEKDSLTIRMTFKLNTDDQSMEMTAEGTGIRVPKKATK